MLTECNIYPHGTVNVIKENDNKNYVCLIGSMLLRFCCQVGLFCPGGGGQGSVIFLLIGKAIKNFKKEKEKMLDYLQILLTNSHNLF